MTRTHRSAFTATCLLALVVTVPRLASAQAPTSDPRWTAWVGCWGAGPMDALGGALARPVCVVPAGGSAVDIVSIADGRVAARERIDANGEQRPAERDGCTGWQSARWSADGRRVYLRSEHQCAAGVKRSSSGLVAMSPAGEWLDVVSVTSGKDTGVRVIRHREISNPAGLTGLPQDVVSALKAIPASRIDESRTLAVAPIGTADIVEASHQVSDGVVAAWLNDLRQTIAVDAKRLVELANAGVPDRVLDMMVGLAYPQAFAVPPSPTVLGALAGIDDRGAPVARIEPPCSDFSLYGWGSCSPFGYSPFGFAPYGFAPYGYPYSFSQFGYGSFGYFPSSYGGWYANEPAVVIIRPADSGSHGRVINGVGYVAGGSSRGTATSSGSDSSGSSSSGGGGGSVGASSAGDGGRTAQPR